MNMKQVISLARKYNAEDVRHYVTGKHVYYQVKSPVLIPELDALTSELRPHQKDLARNSQWPAWVRRESADQYYYRIYA